jgi:hypothetical protein
MPFQIISKNFSKQVVRQLWKGAISKVIVTGTTIGLSWYLLNNSTNQADLYLSSLAIAATIGALTRLGLDGILTNAIRHHGFRTDYIGLLFLTQLLVAIPLAVGVVADIQLAVLSSSIAMIFNLLFFASLIAINYEKPYAAIIFRGVGPAAIVLLAILNADAQTFVWASLIVNAAFIIFIFIWLRSVRSGWSWTDFKLYLVTSYRTYGVLPICHSTSQSIVANILLYAVAFGVISESQEAVNFVQRMMNIGPALSGVVHASVKNYSIENKHLLLFAAFLLLLLAPAGVFLYLAVLICAATSTIYSMWTLQYVYQDQYKHLFSQNVFYIILTFVAFALIPFYVAIPFAAFLVMLVYTLND